MQVAGSNAENAERWRYLCEHWGHTVDGQPFPVWFHSIRASGIEEAIDIARKYTSRGTLRSDPSAVGD